MMQVDTEPNSKLQATTTLWAILQENDGGVGSNGHFMDVDVNGNSNTAYVDQKY